MNYTDYILVFFIGIITGIINIIAAGGSFLILPVLIFMGLSPNVANATNRLGIILQNLTGSFQFKKNNYFDKKKAISLTIPSILGAILGAFIAVDINETLMKNIISIVMLLTLVFLFVKPQKWIDNQGNNPKPYWIEFIAFFITGIYAGFIQAGAGFFLLTSLVLCSNFNLDKANAYKVLITLFSNILAIAIFSTHQMINWEVAIILGAGSIIGGFWGSKLSIKGGSKFIRLFICIMIILASLKLFFD